MVDFDAEIEMVQSVNIKEIEANKYKIDENIKKSIILYNAAINELRKGNYNLVISDLKKSLSYNKDFLEAIKLMGLCYVKMKEYKKAEKSFKSLNKYTIYDELVKEYLESLSAKKIGYESSTTLETVEFIYKNRNKQAGKIRRGFSKKLVICVLTVMFVIAGVATNYIYPEIFQGVLAKFTTRIKGDEEKLQGENANVIANEESSKNTDEEEVLVEKNNAIIIGTENTKTNTESTKLEAENYKNETVNILRNAEKAINAGNYEEAASLLISMKSRNFEADTKTKFNELWQSLKPNSIWTVYNEGNNLYKQNEYTKALPKLIIASEFEPSLELMPWLTFQIGMCYKETNDNANASIYFNKVKANYPNSEYVSNAKMMLSEINY